MRITVQEFFAEQMETDEISVVLSKLSPKQKTLLLTFLESLDELSIEVQQINGNCQVPVAKRPVQK